MGEEQGVEVQRAEPEQAGIGHNSGDEQVDTPKDETRDVGGISGERLRSFVERIERLEEEKSHIAEDIKEVYAELKGVGYDAKTVRKLVSLRKIDAEKRREDEELLSLYRAAVGMI